MKTTVLFLSFAVLAAPLFGEDPDLREIRPRMQELVDDGSVIGVVTLVDRGGLSVQLDAAGCYRTDSIFQIMSMSKPFVSVGIMILVERGRIPSVDTRVAALPGFESFPYREITIRQLLTHTSGMWYKRQVSPGLWFGIGPLLTNRLDQAPDVTVRDKPLAFVARHHADPELYPLDPASPAFHYSNIGYLMLGWIIEELGGQPLDRFLKSEIFDKLGMRDTFFFPDLASPEQRARIAMLDRRRPDPPDYDHYDERRPGWRYASPGGGIYSTAEDLRSFLMIFRHEGQAPGRERILQPASIAMLTADQVPDLDCGCGGRTGRSLGFAVTRAPGCANSPAYSPGTISHTGRFSTEFWYDPVKDEIGLVLNQVVTGEGYRRPERPILQRLLSVCDARKP